MTSIQTRTKVYLKTTCRKQKAELKYSIYTKNSEKKPVKQETLTQNIGCDSSDAHDSCVEVKINPFRVVELRSPLIHPPAVDAAAEIAFLHPTLQKQSVRRLKPTRSDWG